MKKTALAPLIVMFCLFAFCLKAADFWQAKSPAEWTQKQLQKMITALAVGAAIHLADERFVGPGKHRRRRRWRQKRRGRRGSGKSIRLSGHLRSTLAKRCAAQTGFVAAPVGGRSRHIPPGQRAPRPCGDQLHYCRFRPFAEVPAGEYGGLEGGLDNRDFAGR